MGALNEIGLYVLQTLGSLYIALIVIRFLLQLARADFYNPVSQFLVKATNPLLLPLRKIIPGIFGLDMACIVLAIVLHWLLIQGCAAIIGAGFLNPFHVLTWAIVGLVGIILNIYKWGLLISIILSWIAPHNPNPAVLLLNQLLAPMMRPFRRLIPDMGGFDISPIFAFLVLGILGILLSSLAYEVGIGGVVASLVVGV
ncbi:YggT family protein [Pseudoteredinibacter isoporae]|uniref:YggT family protein n=1 Tax=Pseudoteredinibacter isoporae TaxID=570281 RepID=A0A7X0MWJ3_9GAMM|nr:YggT family protein [Pseudoteredinibacter isoporae]MBB6519902.1 YggT family protein [Pseudoteredinibacter isoporae]NHO85480.1 YggT family protein [Pseudoteredinibacter isoporae]NIB26068.1 YggT family protein [Pseudoteredinibacter isoporae]